MNSGEQRYIWQADDWPDWRFDVSALTGPLTEVSRAQGVLLGRLGVDIDAVAPVDQHVEGVVEMVLDATLHSTDALTAKRLSDWHAALFTTTCWNAPRRARSM